MTLIKPSRRGFLKGAGAVGAASAFPAPFVRAQSAVTLRYLSTAVNQSPAIAQRASEELGINIEYIAVTTDDVARRVITQPNSFDLVDTEYFALPNLVPSGNLMPMDASRIDRADQIESVLTESMVRGEQIGTDGTAPSEVFYLQGEGSQSFASEPTQWLSLIPTTYNADTLGIRPDLIDQQVDSWAQLLNPDFAGRASILNIPSIGIMDAAMALEARGDIMYDDKGNMTREEIDQTVAALIEAKNNGQFRAFWSNFQESVNLMASGEVVIQSMWSPAVTAVRTQGIPCRYQPLQEGYRGWASGFTMPRTISEQKQDAAYEFINWFLSGWAGAHLTKQGYYPAILDTAREYLEDYEAAYWYDGEEAAQDITNPSGDIMEQAGAVRDGGSYWNRMGSIACWNSVMDENQYMVQKWNEFIAA